MGNINTLIEHLAEIISDYRNGEIKPLGPEHVQKWINQFDEHVRLDILSELLHVLSKTYIKKKSIHTYFQRVISSKKISLENGSDFWWTANFLNIQTEGESQKVMLKLFGEELLRVFDLEINNCGSETGSYVYIDDASFSGTRILNDLRLHISNCQRSTIEIFIFTYASHTKGREYAVDELSKFAASLSKVVNIKWYSRFVFENRSWETNCTDILSPSEIPDDNSTKEYICSLGHKYRLRQPGSLGSMALFSSERSRNILEREFLIAGVKIRSMYDNKLNKYFRPLGNYVLNEPGFGSLLVTYRNCPNNCPLALWWGASKSGPEGPASTWYPLFPRKIN